MAKCSLNPIPITKSAGQPILHVHFYVGTKQPLARSKVSAISPAFTSLRSVSIAGRTAELTVANFVTTIALRIPAASVWSATCFH